jgi:hypothetical protein
MATMELMVFKVIKETKQDTKMDVLIRVPSRV